MLRRPIVKSVHITTKPEIAVTISFNNMRPGIIEFLAFIKSIIFYGPKIRLYARDAAAHGSRTATDRGAAACTSSAANNTADDAATYGTGRCTADDTSA